MEITLAKIRDFSNTRITTLQKLRKVYRNKYRQGSVSVTLIAPETKVSNAGDKNIQRWRQKYPDKETIVSRAGDCVGMFDVIISRARARAKMYF